MKGLTRSRGRGAQLASPIVKRTIRFNKTFTMTDPGAAAGWGTVVLEGLPQGNICLVGTVMNYRITKNDANIITTFAATVALGSAPTADNTLSGGEIDIIPATAAAVASGGVSSGNRAPSTGTQNGTILDNTDGSLELNLNMTVTDASITANGSVTVDGTLVIAYVVLADD